MNAARKVDIRVSIDVVESKLEFNKKETYIT